MLGNSKNNNSQNYSNIYDNNMDNTNLNQSIGAVINPKAKRYKAFDIEKDRFVNYTNQYGRTAKRLYKQYIGIGHDPEMVIPATLKFYPYSGRFYRQKPQKEKPPWLEIEEKSSFKKYLATYSLSNKLNVQAYAGVDLMKQFKPQLLKMLSLHNGIKFYFDLQCLMVKYLDGDILTQDNRWVSSRRE